MPDYQAVVSGGGAVGLITAHTLAQEGYSTLVLDRKEQEAPLGNWHHDLRQLTVAKRSIQQLQDLGITLPNELSQIHKMHIWERDGSASVSMSACEVAEDVLAYVVEHRLLEEAIQEHSSSNLTIQSKISISALDQSQQEITLSNSQTIRPDLLVIAEGIQSDTREKLGLDFQFNKDLKSKAVVSLIQLAEPHQNVAWQIFNPTPLALLPCADPSYMSLIWSLSTEEAEQVLSMDDSEFLTALSESCEEVCGKIVATDKRLSFPLFQNVVSDFNPLPWILLLGDSARRIHPLAGQGINLGFEDVRAMGSVLGSQPSSLNQPGLWREFAEKRKIRSVMMTGLMSFFLTVYSSSSPYFRLMRNTGVRFVDQNQTLKKQLIREAMGVGPIASVL